LDLSCILLVSEASIAVIIVYEALYLGCEEENLNWSALLDNSKLRVESHE
jgi:hypothetical protein